MAYAMPDYEELLKRARLSVDMTPKGSFVEDAVVFGRFILDEHERVRRDLVEARRRCSILVEENAALRKKLGEMKTPVATST